MFPDNVYGHLQVTSDGTLEIRSVQKDDAGYYVCSAFSVAGSGTTRAFLQVSFFPHVPQRPQKSNFIAIKFMPTQKTPC